MNSSNETTKRTSNFYCIFSPSMKKIWFVILLCFIIVIFCTSQIQLRNFKYLDWFNSGWTREDKLYTPTCVNVLDRAVVGRWVKRDVSRQEVEQFYNAFGEYQKESGLSENLQRPDGKCGNLHLQVIDEKGKRRELPFRALCNPNGTVPCCFEYKCVSRPVEQCRCEHCFDMRQQIHAELSTWLPADPGCQIVEFKGNHDTCRILKNATIYFIGDSFMSQLYISFSSLVRETNQMGTLQKNTLSEEQRKCTGLFRILKRCRTLVDITECENRTRLRTEAFWRVDQIDRVVKVIAELQGRPNSFLVLGGGGHMNFDLNVVENKILKPIMNQLAKSPWPIPIWLSTHSVGILKAPMSIHQQTDKVVKYNLRINYIVRKNNFTVMDFYQMTNNVMSFDGAHYGTGVNDLKAQILLNYILEVRINNTGFS